MHLFNELSSMRQSGMSLGPIPILSIFQYLDEIEVYDQSERQYYKNHIMAFDDIFLSCQAEKTRKAQTQAKS